MINAEQLLNLGAPEEVPEGTMVGSASAPALLAEGEAPAEEGGGGGVKFTEGTNAEKTPEAQAKSLRHQRKSLGERASAQAKRVQKWLQKRARLERGVRGSEAGSLAKKTCHSTAEARTTKRVSFCSGSGRHSTAEAGCSARTRKRVPFYGGCGLLSGASSAAEAGSLSVRKEGISYRGD